MNILEGIIEELHVVALKKKSNDQFEIINQGCRWFQQLCEGLGHPLDNHQTDLDISNLCSLFPFVENFLIDAGVVWKEAQTSSACSGIWTEVDQLGIEFQLEAKALLIQGQPILLIENKSPNYDQVHSIYQKARDIALLNEKLISELNQRQRQLQNDIERHLLRDKSIQQVAESIQGHTSAVMICQPNGEVEVLNKALVDIYKLDSNIDLQRISLLDQWLEEAERAYPELKRVIESGSYWEGEFESQNSLGSKHWVRLTIGPIRKTDGIISHYVCVANDISELRGTETMNAPGAGYDVTTHLPNRKHFWAHINDLAETELSSDYGIGLLYIDLDYFKRINDDLGHQAGDFLLSSIATRISRCVKYHDFVAHLGGDEFIVVVQYIEQPEQLEIVAERLLAAIHQPMFVNNQSLMMTASIGISSSFESHIDPKELLKQADLAMYAAKELGKGQSRFYDPSMKKHIPHKLQRERELLDALERQEFVLYLQPQISLSGKESLRAEALIRWQHPKHGLLPPADFIAIAEESGLIVPLGNWVIRQACEMGVRLLNDGKQVSIAANISAKQLKHPDFFNKLTASLNETGMPANLLELEITESSFLEDLASVICLIKKIRSLGVTIALDDFGTGFSSLNYLRQLPVDFLKIDRSFIKELHVDHESQAITSSVITLARVLNIDVIAEGVETNEQLEFLKRSEVNFVQGFIFYRPLTFEALQQSYTTIKKLNDENSL